MGGGNEGYGRALFAASPPLWTGHLLAAFELDRADGPWVHPDGLQRQNGALRYSQGDAVDASSLTAMAYHGRWNSNGPPRRRACRRKQRHADGGLNEPKGGVATLPCTARVNLTLGF